jgi:hypothetical protein
VDSTTAASTAGMLTLKPLENATPGTEAAAGHPAGRFGPRPGRVPQLPNHSHPLVHSQPRHTTSPHRTHHNDRPSGRSSADPLGADIIGLLVTEYLNI